MVGGVNPRKAGRRSTSTAPTLPVFASVAEAMAETGADVTVIFVPPAFTKAAVVEAIDAAIPLAVVITEGVPVHDTAAFWAHNVGAGRSGPGSSGRTARASPRPAQSNAGIIPADITGAGRIGLVSKSRHADLPDDVRAARHRLLHRVGIGGDPIIGTTHIDALAAFQADPDTDAIVMIGEIGGDAEERAAEFIKANVTKPVVGYIAGFTAPPGKTMGHAGAIISGSAGTADAKKAALEAAGVKVGKTPSETARLMREIMSGS